MFTAPISFREALQSREVRSILPTSLGSAELDEIEASILERAMFSARVESAEYLQTIADVLEAYIDGTADLASSRAQLKEKLREIGYVAEPDDFGTIKDFGSDLRTNLVLRTNAEMAHGYGKFIQGQDPDILDEFPAQELYRGAPAIVPRNWIARWSAAGGGFPGGRMIALKNAPIWFAISRFGTPYEPFDFGSHMITRDINRATAVELGLIDRDTQITPDDRGFNDDLRFSPAVRSAAIRQALTESDPRLQFDGDVLTLK